MIIPNIIIGTDKYGNKLFCGDVCLFEIKLRRPKEEEKIEKLKGMIVYDEDSYAFSFETLDGFAPILCMYCAEYGSVEKLFEANATNFSNVPDGDLWKGIYNNNVRIL